MLDALFGVSRGRVDTLTEGCLPSYVEQRTRAVVPVSAVCNRVVMPDAQISAGEVATYV